MSTFLDLQTKVFKFLNENQTTPNRWDVTSVKAYINDGYLQYVTDTAMLRSANAGLSFGLNGQVSMPADVVEIDRIERKDGKVLRQEDESRLDLLVGSDWRTRTGPPVAYLYGRNTKTIYLYPNPDQNAINNYSPLTLYYIARVVPSGTVPTLVADTDVPQIFPEFHDALVWYAIWECYRWNKDTASVELANDAYAHYQDQVNKGKELVAANFDPTSNTVKAEAAKQGG